MIEVRLLTVTYSKMILPYRPTNLTGIVLFNISMFVRLGARREAYKAGDVADDISAEL
jgi:hypothetical protein